MAEGDSHVYFGQSPVYGTGLLSINLFAAPVGPANNASWAWTFTKSFFTDFSFKGARLPGESFGQCVSRSENALLGQAGTTALNVSTPLAAFGALYTTPLTTPPGPVPGVSMGPMSSWELDTFNNAAAGAKGFATASKFAPAASATLGLITAVGTGVKGGFLVACAH